MIDKPLADPLFNKLTLTILIFLGFGNANIESLLIVLDRFLLKESNNVEFGMAIATSQRM
jgi:hypothetical protein